MTGFPQPAGSRLGQRTSLLAGAMLAVRLAAAPGRADISFGGPRGEDRKAPIVFQADEVAYDDQLALTVAKGHVEISQGGEILLADTVSYNQRTDTVSASGHGNVLMPPA